MWTNTLEGYSSPLLPPPSPHPSGSKGEGGGSGAEVFTKGLSVGVCRAGQPDAFPEVLHVPLRTRLTSPTPGMTRPDPLLRADREVHRVRSPTPPPADVQPRLTQRSHFRRRRTARDVPTAHQVDSEPRDVQRPIRRQGRQRTPALQVIQVQSGLIGPAPPCRGDRSRCQASRSCDQRLRIRSESRVEGGKRRAHSCCAPAISAGSNGRSRHQTPPRSA